MIERHQAAGITMIERPGADPVPILFLHGIGGNAASFAPFFASLGGTARLIAWDAPGYGGSAPLPHDWPAAVDYAAAAVAAMDGRGIARFAVVGHSLGCLVAGALAAHWPERIDRVAFVSPALGMRVAKGSALPPPAQSRLDDFARLGPAGVAAARAPLLLAKDNRTAEIVAAVSAGLAALTMPGYAQATRMLAGGDLIGDAAAIQCEALIVTGSEDAITPPKGGDLLAATLNARTPARQTRHVILPGCGHMPFHEAPAALATALGAFLEL